MAADQYWVELERISARFGIATAIGLTDYARAERLITEYVTAEVHRLRAAR